MQQPEKPERKGFRGFYSRPAVQVALVALVCFACPGMFNALSGIGGGGQVDATASDNGSVALYSTFAVTSFFSGTIINRLGAPLTLGVGAAAYSLYIGSLLSYNFNKSDDFVVAAGAILGVGAGMLWTAQGSMTLAYATEQEKGRMMALFWSIFNLGAVIGSAMEIGLAWNTQANTVSNGAYSAFLAIAALGAFLPILLIKPSKMVRDDGTKVELPSHPTWTSELVGLFKCLKTDPWVILLFPYFLSSNWFYTWQFNDYNGALFTLRTRALNSMLYWLFQVFGATAFGTFMDSTHFVRRTRAWIGFAIVTCLVFTIFGGSYHIQLRYKREDVGVVPRIDLKDHNYPGYVILYIFMGIMDSVYQNYIYWLMGSMSNKSAKLAHFVGFYKSIQSAASAGCFRLDANKTAFMTQLSVGWGVCAGALVFLAPAIHLRVTNHTEEDSILTPVDSVDQNTALETKDQKSAESEA
ncbi:MFS general substrate transporter [Meredithblackwellia eburnea MCA 4105]